jgi:hypothetical protein
MELNLKTRTLPKFAEILKQSRYLVALELPGCRDRFKIINKLKRLKDLIKAESVGFHSLRRKTYLVGM